MDMLKKLVSKKRLFVLLSMALVLTPIALYLNYHKHYSSDFNDYIIDSKVLNEQRKIFVRLPRSYDQAKSYPLIIKTDGNFNLKRWHNSVADLQESSPLHNAIIVAIPNQFWQDTRNRDLVPPYARRDVQVPARPQSENSKEIFGKADLFLQFIDSELLPFIEQKYRVNEQRILSGYSAGGSFVLYTIATKPTLFDGYFAFSPAAWYDDSVVVKEFSKTLKTLANEPLFFYLSIGGEENSIITGSFRGLLSAIDKYAPDKFEHKYHFVQGADHGTNPYESVPLALSAYADFKR